MLDRIVSKLVIGKQPTEKKNFLWNMIGSGIYSASSMLLSLVIIKLVGANQGGIFSIAITLSQMFVYIAYFEMRTFQVTDAKDQFSFSEYHATKILLCILMLLVSGGYVLFKQYDLEKMIIIFLMCFARAIDGYSDVYEAHFQKIGRLDLAGKSLAYRTIWFVFVLIFILLLTEDLIISLVAADIVAVTGVFIYNVCVMRVIDKITCTWNVQRIKEIIFSCCPLFIGVFCWTYILSASRIAIDGVMSSEYQAYYQVIFMPVSVISLFAGFIFRPMLPRLSKEYNMKHYKNFYEQVYKGILCIVGLTILCMIGAYLLGIPILSMLSGCDLSNYRGMLVFLIFAGGFNAIAFIMYYVLTIMRCPKSILVDYLLAAILAFVLSRPLVQWHGIMGAAISYFIVVFILCLLFILSIFKVMIKERKYKEPNEEISNNTSL